MSDPAVIEVETKMCPFCGNRRVFRLNAAAYNRWRGGELIQNAFPDLTPDEREQLISGTCPGCWDRYMSDEE